jgi:hypothetical protein
MLVFLKRGLAIFRRGTKKEIQLNFHQVKNLSLLRMLICQRMGKKVGFPHDKSFMSNLFDYCD